MKSDDSKSFSLPPYRIMDLTDERGVYCTKILADFGADVVYYSGVLQWGIDRADPDFISRLQGYPYLPTNPEFIAMGVPFNVLALMTSTEDSVVALTSVIY